MGEKQFQKGLNSYFKKFKWKNAQLKDLIEEMKNTNNLDFDIDSWC